jgi:flagellar biosynthesis activator protein FlaF
MSAMHTQAYRNIQKATISSEREIDAYALTECALRLKECQDNWDNMTERDKIDQLFNTLKINSRLWSIFQAEITREDNQLPQDVRENVLSLSLFVDQRTKDIMCFPESEKLTILININLNLAAGLRAKPQQNEPGQPEPQRRSDRIAIAG